MTTPRALHQLLPSLAPRDAIGAHTLAIRKVLHEHGIPSEIYCAEAHRELRSVARSYREWPGGSDAVMLYHAAIGCALGDWVAARPETLVLDYHNITPPEYFEGWQPETGLLLAQGRSQLAALAPRADLGLADSAYNAEELVQLGCPRTAVVPIFVDPVDWGASDDAVAARLRASKRGTDWLFVGRIAANKAHHDLICAFAMFRRVFDPGARLWLVGGTSAGEYQRALERLVARLGLAEQVTFAGSIDDGALGAYFREADVFVCLSEHEGFCVPLVEAMWWGTPVVAYAAAAVPATVADAGVLLTEKDPATVAVAVDRVMRDETARAALVEAGRRRVDDFAPAQTAAALLRELASIGVEP